MVQTGSMAEPMLQPLSKAGAKAQRGYTYVAVLLILVVLSMGPQVPTIPAKTCVDP